MFKKKVRIFKIRIFFCQKIWRYQIIVVPLHSEREKDIFPEAKRYEQRRGATLKG